MCCISCIFYYHSHATHATSGCFFSGFRWSDPCQKYSILHAIHPSNNFLTAWRHHTQPLLFAMSHHHIAMGAHYDHHRYTTTQLPELKDAIHCCSSLYVVASVVIVHNRQSTRFNLEQMRCATLPPSFLDRGWWKLRFFILEKGKVMSWKIGSTIRVGTSRTKSRCWRLETDEPFFKHWHLQLQLLPFSAQSWWFLYRGA